MEAARTHRRTVALVALVAIAAIAPAAGASAATLRLRAPKEIDRAETFRVVAKGKAKPRKDYLVSVLYHDDDQGRCARTVAKEITRNEHYAVLYQRKVVTDDDGRFELTSRKVVGGERKTTGRFCGYLTNEDGDNKDKVVRPIAFT
jgi:hypothetical protein